MSRLDDRDFDAYHSLSARASQQTALASNDAFVVAMNKAIRKGREKVKAGTFVDHTPPIGAVRIRGETLMSSCGSPAAMCVDTAIAAGGAGTMKA
jgi:pyridoxine/pyridoxamine 5'-phosphate oxidase